MAPLSHGRAFRASAAVGKQPSQPRRWVAGASVLRRGDLGGLSVAIRYGPHYALTGVHRTYRPEPPGTKPRALHLTRRPPPARKPAPPARTSRPGDGGGDFGVGGGNAAAVGYATHPESRRFFGESGFGECEIFFEKLRCGDGWRWAWAMGESFRVSGRGKRRSGGDPFGRWARWYGRHGEAKRAWAREWMRVKRAKARAAALAVAVAPGAATALALAGQAGTVDP